MPVPSSTVPLIGRACCGVCRWAPAKWQEWGQEWSEWEEVHKVKDDKADDLSHDGGGDESSDAEEDEEDDEDDDDDDDDEADDDDDDEADDDVGEDDDEEEEEEEEDDDLPGGRQRRGGPPSAIVGVFAAKPIKPGEKLGAYLGECLVPLRLRGVHRLQCCPSSLADACTSCHGAQCTALFGVIKDGTVPTAGERITLHSKTSPLSEFGFRVSAGLAIDPVHVGESDMRSTCNINPLLPSCTKKRR